MMDKKGIRIDQVLLNKRFPLVTQEALGASALDTAESVFICLGSWQVWSTAVTKYVCSVHVLLRPSSLFMNQLQREVTSIQET